MTEHAALYHFAVAEGVWTGPWQLRNSLDWRGICALSRGWAAIAIENGRVGLWHLTLEGLEGQDANTRLPPAFVS